MSEYFIQINKVKRTEKGLWITCQAEVPFREETDEMASNYDAAIALLDAKKLPFYDFIHVPNPDQSVGESQPHKDCDKT